VTTPIESTTGHEDARDPVASLWIGGFDACASPTSRAICASAVSLPTGGRLDLEGAVAVDRSADHAVPYALLDRDGLAGQHRLVDGGEARAHDAVDGHRVARLHAQPVAARDRPASGISRSAPFSSLRAVRGAEVEQAPDRVRRASRARGLEPAAQAGAA
jgi:hypothetical protein